ncbi:MULTISPECIES: molybdopterin guanine dinucleotide-containing S/N-oxide reductase [unclassified Roseovarius]|uniref:molybdopterin guanine dinucleotide-containing S/N-oxide reductase n=1 Tax=unclassified Roseovarius TaxID=2614913 RepID=UPI00273F308D|nr:MULTISPECIES: molybdopterin guanine dinucleotide-containing S/N-oxide reductase [unclassified Roseovarius]
MTKHQDLPLTSSHWGTYRARVSNGRVQELLPFEHDRDPSPIGPGILDVQHGPTRIDAPMVRQSWLEGGPGTRTDLRGSDPFVEVSWEEANKLVAAELTRVRQTHGNRAIFGGSYGWASAGRFHHAQSQLKRFLNCIGGYTGSKFTYSFAAAEAMVPHILGSFRAYLDTCTSYDSIRDNTQLFVCFGGVPLKNGQISQGGTGCHIQRDALLAAGRAEIDFVNISPLKSDLLDEVGGEWLALRPNTDVALMLGLAHTLEAEGLADYAFLERYTVGSGQFLSYVMGESDGVAKTADWAADITEIPAETIRALARRMAAERTMISVSWSLTRQDHGEQPFWAAIALAAMLGQIGLPGGGFGFGYSAMNFIGGRFTILPGASFPQGKNAVSDFIPVARITDLLTRPGEPFDFDGVRYEYPDIRLVWWAGGNPFHHHQDLNLLMEAWTRPETVIANEWCWNSLAKRADIVLPCTTPLERQDIAMTPRDPYVVSMSKLTEPYGQARDDFEIFAGIAREMGVEDRFGEGRSSAEWQREIYDQTITRARGAGIDIPDYESFIRKGWFKLDDPPDPVVMLSDFRADPVANPLATPSGRIEIFSQTVADFGYDDCPGHPVWRAPYEWLGNADRYPLHLLSNQPKDKLHSQFDHGGVSRAKKVAGREPVHIHPEDAAARGLKDGDIVRLFNDRGACLGGVVTDADLRPGVVQMSTGAWYDPDETGLCKHGNPNVLTRDKGTSKLGQGPSAHSCLVEIERYTGAPPTVTAHDAPEILRPETPDAPEVQE